MNGRYTDHDRHRHRWVSGAVGSRGRSAAAFILDRQRIAASAAFARLAGTAEIDPPRTTPVPHHRQAHSVAVAHLGRQLAAHLGADTDLVQAACLAHDLGHPPFGHDGERALATIATACGGFNANAQTLRILTRLGPLIPRAMPPDGLHLTRATLDATCKYPWPATTNPHRFGVYPDDLPTLAWIRDGAPTRRLCLEAQIMDWADDLTNAVHDLTHGIRTHRTPLTALLDPTDRDALASLATRDITTQPHHHITAAANALAELPLLREVATLRAPNPTQLDTALTTITTDLTQRYLTPVVEATLAHHTATSLARHHADLHIPNWARAELAVLTAMTLHYLLRTPANRQRRARRIERITELTHHVLAHAPHTLAPPLQPAWHNATDDTTRLRVVLDHIAALTDTQAAHRRLDRRGADGVGAVSRTVCPACSVSWFQRPASGH